MFERYTDKARRAVFFARYEVSELGGSAIDPEHLLLGLLREDASVIPRLLGEREKSMKKSMRERIEERCRAGEKLSASVEVPLSREAKDVLRYAAEESDAGSYRHVGTEHLLLGLLRAEGSFALEVLREQGIEYAGVRQVVKELYGA